MGRTKVAIVYEKATTWGGAERLLLNLADMFPQADLFVSLYYPDKAAWAARFAQVKTSVWNMFSRLRFLPPELWLALDWHMFTRFDFSDYDLVISVSSYQAKYLITPVGVKHVNYCLSPTRYLWSERSRYAWQQWWADRRVSDQYSAWLADQVLTLSHLVRRRIKKYYGRDATVIYPGVEVEQFDYQDQKQNFFLLVSRLVDYKRVDLAIAAAQKLGARLVIVGTGPARKKLQRLAAGAAEIEFAGHVSERQLKQYYAAAKAVIMPQIEDFGLVGLEAWASGTPVVTHSDSGFAELDPKQMFTVQFSQQTVDSLAQAIEQLQSRKWDYAAIRQAATQYDWQQFKQKFLAQI